MIDRRTGTYDLSATNTFARGTQNLSSFLCQSRLSEVSFSKLGFWAGCWWG